jgi:excinuclease ABC subunit A
LFETAQRHQTARPGQEIDSGREQLFSARFACWICSYSLRAGAAPVLVQQRWALPALRRLGSISFFDPKRIVAFLV